MNSNPNFRQLTAGLYFMNGGLLDFALFAPAWLTGCGGSLYQSVFDANYESAI